MEVVEWGYGEASLFCGIGIEILFGIMGITIKDIPISIAITGHIFVGLLIYGILGVFAQTS